MCDSPKISILVPCYNVDPYLRQCMDSIVNQSLKELEIICINDGSTDSTLEILEDYASKDDRIVIIDKPNSGYGASMNIGMEKARGQYIGIVESDDYIEPDMFEKLYKAASDNNLDYARCHFRHVGDMVTDNICVVYNGIENNKIFNSKENRNIFFITTSIWAAICRREMINVNGIRFLETPGASYQDTSFAFKTIVSSDRLMVLSDVLHNYRINESSSVNSSGKIFSVCDEFGEMRRWASERGVYEEFKEVIGIKSFRIYKWNYGRLKDMSFKRQFMKRWSAEAKLWFENGEITSKYFSIDRRFRLWLVAYCPWAYHFSKKV